jgi:hypothetical protein
MSQRKLMHKEAPWRGWHLNKNLDTEWDWDLQRWEVGAFQMMAQCVQRERGERGKPQETERT